MCAASIIIITCTSPGRLFQPRVLIGLQGIVVVNRLRRPEIDIKNINNLNEKKNRFKGRVIVYVLTAAVVSARAAARSFKDHTSLFLTISRSSRVKAPFKIYTCYYMRWYTRIIYT